MKINSRLIVIFAALLFVPCLAIVVYAACANGIAGFADSYNNCFAHPRNSTWDTFDKFTTWSLRTVNGSYSYKTDGVGAGCLSARDNGTALCYPLFYPETWQDVNGNTARFRQETRSVSECVPTPIYHTFTRVFQEDFTCVLPGEECEEFSGSHWNEDTGQCEFSVNPGCGYGTWGFSNFESSCPTYYWDCECWPGGPPSPILIDTSGDGFRLSAAREGVDFDIEGRGSPRRVAWTLPNSDDCWLALDRNGNGQVDSGAELFGNYTAQPESQNKNGFLALAVFDHPAQGGNADGVIDGRDAVFSSLRLWSDANHDGVAQPSELSVLPTFGVALLHLDYKESKRVDEHGNEFRYRAKVDDARGAKAGRWAWDVFLKFAP